MPKKEQYKIVLEMAGKEYPTKGDTLLEAFNKLPLTWNEIKAKGIITVSKDKVSYEHFFSLMRLRKIMGNKLTRRLWAKRLGVLLEGTVQLGDVVRICRVPSDKETLLSLYNLKERYARLREEGKIIGEKVERQENKKRELRRRHRLKALQDRLS